MTEALALADVRLHGFTPGTYEFVAKMAEAAFGHPALSFARPTVIPLTSAAALFFMLRATDDSRFPGGKWATIQHLESLIDDAVGLIS